MKRWLLITMPIISILALTSGCLFPFETPPPEPTNQAPTAYIDSVSPAQVAEGEIVKFTGHGTDPDGTIVAYRWRSSLDNDLSTQANFETSALSVGKHSIYLKVQDNNGTWSGEVSGSVTVLGVVVPPPGDLPVIDSFKGEPSDITAGESSTLTWTVSGATKVSLDQGIGNVALSGSRIVSPEETTVYTLTATNSEGSIDATVEIVVEAPLPPEEHTVDVVPVVNESGYVRDNGDVVPKFIYAGDDTNNFSLQAFISFDISDIPNNATITKVVADFTDLYSIYGDPFGDLGCLVAYRDDYGSLDAGDYTTVFRGGLIKYCDADEIVAKSIPLVADALQDKVGSSRFQMRLQFPDTETDGDGNNDLMLWQAPHLPRLVVTYTVPQ